MKQIIKPKFKSTVIYKHNKYIYGKVRSKTSSIVVKKKVEKPHNLRDFEMEPHVYLIWCWSL